MGTHCRLTDGAFIVMRDPAGGMTFSFDVVENCRPPAWPEQPDAPRKMMHFEMQVVRVMLDPGGTSVLPVLGVADSDGWKAWLQVTDVGHGTQLDA